MEPPATIAACSSAHGRVDLGCVAYDGERPGDALLALAAEEVRYAHGSVLLEDLDAIAAERRRNPLAVQELPNRRLRPRMQLRGKRNCRNK